MARRAGEHWEEHHHQRRAERGSEDLTIEGRVDGKIELRDHVLTVGPNGRIKAQVCRQGRRGRSAT